GGARPWAVDVRHAEAMSDWAARVVTEFSHIDGLINNAGIILPARRLEHIAMHDLRTVVDVNLWGQVNGTLAFLPHLRDRPVASLVNVTSVASVAAMSGNAGYSMSKFAARGFTEALRMELMGSTVQVTLVIPGFVRTNILRNAPGFEEGERRAA